MNEFLAWFPDVVNGFGEGLNAALAAILGFVESVSPIWRTLLVGIGMLLETSILVGLIVPGDTIVLVSSTAVVGPVEYISLVLAVIVGSLCGESIGFALGRHFGPRIRASRLGRRMGEKNWVRAENYLDRRGGIAVFLSRFLPVFHSVIPLTVGMSTMTYRRFMTWTIPASVIWAFAYVSVGSLAGGSYRELSDTLHSAGYIFVAIIAAFLMVVLIAKKILGKLEARHMEHHESAHSATDDASAEAAARESSTSGEPTHANADAALSDPHKTRGRTP